MPLTAKTVSFIPILLPYKLKRPLICYIHACIEVRQAEQQSQGKESQIPKELPLA